MILPILYQDNELIAVNKPAGLLVHRTALDRNETQFALQLLRDQIGQHVYPLHRLDRPTSGVLLFAKSSESARLLSEAFVQRMIHKSYLAVVRGVPRLERGTIDYPLKEEIDPQANPLAKMNKEAQDAVTDYQCLASTELNVQVDRYPTSRYALVRAWPKTGRQHQIRRHLRHLGHPIVGDVNHGVGKHNRYFAQALGCRRLLLACTDVRFTYPGRTDEIKIRAPLAADFADLMIRLGWSAHVAH